MLEADGSGISKKTKKLEKKVKRSVKKETPALEKNVKSGIIRFLMVYLVL